MSTATVSYAEEQKHGGRGRHALQAIPNMVVITLPCKLAIPFPGRCSPMQASEQGQIHAVFLECLLVFWRLKNTGDVADERLLQNRQEACLADLSFADVVMAIAMAPEFAY